MKHFQVVQCEDNNEKKSYFLDKQKLGRSSQKKPSFASKTTSKPTAEKNKLPPRKESGGEIEDSEVQLSFSHFD